MFVGLDLALRPIHRGNFLYFVTLKDENARVRQAIACLLGFVIIIDCMYIWLEICSVLVTYIMLMRSIVKIMFSGGCFP